MEALIDGDILRYEVGFGAETGWKSITERDELPPWDYVQEMLHQRIDYIVSEAKADSYKLYISKGRCFRDNIATVKPYKPRIENKPWHFKNLTMYMRDVLNANVSEGIEADDAMAIKTIANPGQCIICSRDKDLRQVPGWFYSWELGNQASYGPENINIEGSLSIRNDRKGLIGTGFAWFCAQVLMGDRTDNIPGLPGWGPVKVYDQLSPDVEDIEALSANLQAMYDEEYGSEWEERLLEQGRLCWMTRRLLENGEPELWQIGMTS